MTLAFFLKIFTDLCFYTCFSAFFAGLCGLESTILPQLALAAAAGALARALWVKKPGPARVFTLFLLILCFVLPCETAGRVILIPATAYVLWTVWRCRFDLGYFAAADVFSLECKLLPLPALFALVLGEAATLERFSIPYFLVFALGSILLLRMLRHDEQTLSQPRFRLMNLLSLALLCLAGAAMGSPWFRHAVSAVLKTVWSVVAVPLFWVVGGVAAILAYLLGGLLTRLLNGRESQALEQMMQMLESGEDQGKETLEQIASEPDPTRQMIFTAVLLVLAAIVTIFVFRALRGKRQDEHPPAGQQSRHRADPLPNGEKPLSRLTARTPALQVRSWYQQFLKKTRAEGGGLSPAMHTRQQTGVAEDLFSGQKEPLARLRQLYLPARYKEEATEADAREAKELYRQLKK